MTMYFGMYPPLTEEELKQREKERQEKIKMVKYKETIDESYNYNELKKFMESRKAKGEILKKYAEKERIEKQEDIKERRWKSLFDEFIENARAPMHCLCTTRKNCPACNNGEFLKENPEYKELATKYADEEIKKHIPKLPERLFPSDWPKNDYE